MCVWSKTEHQSLSWGNLEAHHHTVCFAFRKPHFFLIGIYEHKNVILALQKNVICEWKITFFSLVFMVH